jgi:hypothetical protein
MFANLTRSSCLLGLIGLLFTVGGILLPGVGHADDTRASISLSDPSDAEIEASAYVFPDYIVDKGRMLALYSNRKWEKSGATAKPASQLKKYLNSTYGSDPAYYVWIGKCKTAQQTMVLERDVVLSGSPKNLKVFFSAYVYASAKIYFNKKLAYEADPLREGFIPDSVAKLLQEGENNIKVYLTKKAGNYSCDSFSGVFFGFEGYFDMDLKVGVPAKSQNPSYTLARGATVKIKMGNVGSSTVKQAEFGAQINRGSYNGEYYEFELLDLGHSGSFIKSCDVIPPKGSSDFYYRVQCKLEDVGPKEYGWVTVGVRFTPEQIPFDYESRGLGWYIWKSGPSYEGPQETTQGNNTSSVELFFCDKNSSQAGCQKLVKP